MNRKQQKALQARKRKRFNIFRATTIAILLMLVGSHFHQQLGHLAELMSKGAEVAAAAVLELLLIAD